MGTEAESEKSLDVSGHIVLVLDILGYSNLILNSDETQMLNQFDSMVKSVRSDVAKMSGVNCRIRWKMYSDNFLIYAQLPEDEDFLHLTVKGVLMTGAWLQYRMITEYGYMSRGGCCFGNLYVDESYVFGSGLVKAHVLEKEHREPTISVAADVAYYLVSRRSGFHDPLESMSLIRRDEKGCYVDYLTHVANMATRGVTENGSLLRIDDTARYHRVAYETIIRPRLMKSIERNKDDEKKMSSLEYKNRWFVDYHNSICEERCFLDEIIEISDSQTTR